MILNGYLEPNGKFHECEANFHHNFLESYLHNNIENHKKFMEWFGKNHEYEDEYVINELGFIKFTQARSMSEIYFPSVDKIEIITNEQIEFLQKVKSQMSIRQNDCLIRYIDDLKRKYPN